MTNQLRIIAGQWRGRKISFLDQEGLRPTPDRVRETLFNWVQGEIIGARCLDLFAGSGALGFEAASRGAAEVICIEQNQEALACLQQNAQALGANQITLHKQDALTFLRQTEFTRPFDLVFLDPPFASGLLPESCTLLEANGWLKPGATIYLEFGEAIDELKLPANWELFKHKKAGQVYYGLCRRHG